MIRQVSGWLKTKLDAIGISGVAGDVTACFDKAVGNVPLIRTCMLYDTAAIDLDKNMRQLFESHGTDPGPPPPLCSDRSYKARMQIYSTMAFGGSEDAAARYLSGAPTAVIQNLSK